MPVTVDEPSVFGTGIHLTTLPPRRHIGTTHQDRTSIGSQAVDEDINRPLSSDGAVGHDDDPIRQFRSMIDLVKRHEDAHALGTAPTKHLHKGPSRLRIEARSGLIQQNQLRIADEGQNKIDATLLTAAQ